MIEPDYDTWLLIGPGGPFDDQRTPEERDQDDRDRAEYEDFMREFE